jgi:hypothetical protein
MRCYDMLRDDRYAPPFMHPVLTRHATGRGAPKPSVSVGYETAMWYAGSTFYQAGESGCQGP